MQMMRLIRLLRLQKGIHFFLQQLCHIVYLKTESQIIHGYDVEKNIAEFFRTLDTGFFRVRYERCSEGDKKFIFAMVKCGELPCTISNIANQLRKTVKSISPTRAQLINKGIIYAVRYSELDFTVPEFSGFIERLGEYCQWEQEHSK